MNVTGGDEISGQRPLRALEHRHIGSACECRDREQVARRMLDAYVPAGGEQGLHVQAFRSESHQYGEQIVDARVGIDDDLCHHVIVRYTVGACFGGISYWQAPRLPSLPVTRLSGEPARVAITPIAFRP